MIRFSVFILLLNHSLTIDAIFLVVPEDLPTGLIGIYGFAPRIVKGTDSRVGFGFRLGNHADFQIMYELGPQQVTRPLRTRSAPYRQRASRRRPFIELLVKTGFLRISSPRALFPDDEDDDVDDQPR